MSTSAVCAVKKERFYRGIGNFIIQFGLIYSSRKGVIVHGDEEVWKLWKDIKDSRKEGNEGSKETNKETNKEIMNGIYQAKSILKDF